MTPRYYHTPPQQPSTRARCPVCHEAVYSRGGIHPQCAVRQSDRPDPKNKPKEAAEGPGPDHDAPEAEGVPPEDRPTVDDAPVVPPPGS